MIIEFIGPGGVGKTTLEPMVASRLGIAYYPAKKRHGFHGEPLPAWKVWLRRLLSVVRRPGLAWRAFVGYTGSPIQRAWFALDLIRRDLIISRAAKLASGVVASGPVHALCTMEASARTDLKDLSHHVHLSDVYVVLHAAPEEISRRLAGRLGATEEDLGGHADWIERYERAATRILAGVSRPSLVVDADRPPEEVADEIAGGLRPILEHETRVP
jgi:hypothetical protein